jgi:DNA-binding response OmpR family regulator
MNVLVIDDDPQILEALRISLEWHWPDAVVRVAPDGDEGLRHFQQRAPDIVLFDVNMPGKSGFAVLQGIRQFSDVPVLMLTAPGEETAQGRTLELGADDDVVKAFSHLALLARITAVLRRAELPPPLQALPDFQAGDLALHFQSRELTVAGQRVNLTPPEHTLLYHLVRDAGRTLPQRLLLDCVWGEDYDATPDYLKVYISRLRARLEHEGGTHYIDTVLGVGYCFASARDVQAFALPRA